MNLFKRNKLRRLKTQARTAYLRYFQIYETYSCGTSLAEHLSADMCRSKNTFNNAMDQIKRLDPDAPEQRL